MTPALFMTEAANLGVYAAAFKLGQMHLQGEHVKEDVRLALDWSLKAANAGHPGGQYLAVAIIYEHYKKHRRLNLSWNCGGCLRPQTTAKHSLSSGGRMPKVDWSVYEIPRKPLR